MIQNNINFEREYVSSNRGCIYAAEKKIQALIFSLHIFTLALVSLV